MLSNSNTSWTLWPWSEFQKKRGWILSWFKVALCLKTWTKKYVRIKRVPGNRQTEKKVHTNSGYFVFRSLWDIDANRDLVTDLLTYSRDRTNSRNCCAVWNIPNIHVLNIVGEIQKYRIWIEKKAANVCKHIWLAPIVNIYNAGEISSFSP